MKSDTQMLPLELPKQLYQDLKTVADQQNTPMAVVLRSLIKHSISPQAKLLQLRDSGTAKPSSFLDLARPLVYYGPRYHSDKSDDELLYE